MPDEHDLGSPSSTAWRRAAPVKSPTSTKQTSGSSGQQPHRALLGAPAGAQHQRRQALGGHHVDRLHDRRAPRLGARTAGRCRSCRGSRCRRGSRAGRWWSSCARSSPSGTEMTTRRPRSRSTAAPTLSRIICRGTGLIAGPPTSSPRPGLVTTPTPTPPSSSRPGVVRPAHGGGEMRAVRDVGVVAGVLDDDRLGAVRRDVAALHREADQPLAGQRDVDVRLDLLVAQRRSPPPWPPPRCRCRSSSRCAAGRCGPSRCAAGRARAARAVTRAAQPRVAARAARARASLPTRPCGARGSAPGGTGASGSRRPPAPARRAPACACRACAP